MVRLHMPRMQPSIVIHCQRSLAVDLGDVSIIIAEAVSHSKIAEIDSDSGGDKDQEDAWPQKAMQPKSLPNQSRMIDNME